MQRYVSISRKTKARVTILFIQYSKPQFGYLN